MQCCYILKQKIYSPKQQLYSIMDKKCRATPEDVHNHNKGIFHIGQCPNCYSAETIEPEKERRQIAAMAMQGMLAQMGQPMTEPKDYGIGVAAVKYADDLLEQLNK